MAQQQRPPSVEAARLARQANDFLRKGHWLQALDKHRKAAEAYQLCLSETPISGALRPSARKSLELLCAYHSNQTALLSAFLENSALRRSIEKEVTRIVGMEKTSYKNLRDALDGLASLGDRINDQLNELASRRQQSDIKVDLSESFLVVEQNEEDLALMTGGLMLEDPEHAGRESLRKMLSEVQQAHSEATRVIGFLVGENKRLRAVLEGLQREFWVRVFDVKAAVEMANVKTESLSREGVAGDGAEASRELDAAKAAHAEESYRLQRRVRMLEEELEGERRRREKGERVVQAWEKRWEEFRKRFNENKAMKKAAASAAASVPTPSESDVKADAEAPTEGKQG